MAGVTQSRRELVPPVIAERIVVKQERNLGILQALLLHLACPNHSLDEAWATINKSDSNQRPHAAVEKRAVLRLYHATSFISALFTRGNHLPWNNYRSQCCEFLAESPLQLDLFSLLWSRCSLLLIVPTACFQALTMSTLSTYLFSIGVVITIVLENSMTL
ncbi:hypothetical protein J3F83DRAFT_766447 [Trichoderma novae-zelandiae]